jgi:hypothetical protein
MDKKQFERKINDSVVQIEGRRVDDMSVAELADMQAEFNQKLKGIGRQVDELTFKIDHEWFLLVAFSDWHTGNIHTDYDYIQRMINFVIEHPRAYCFINGDMMDNWVHLSPTGGGYEDTLPPPVQQRLVKHHISDLVDAGKCLWIIDGNHEWRSNRQGDMNGLQIIAEQLDIPYMGAGGHVDFHINDQLYQVHARHKFRYESSFNPCHSCMRLIEHVDQDADIVFLAHKHNPAIRKDFRSGKWRSLLRCGSAMHRTGYEKSLGYEDKPLVASWVLMNGNHFAHFPGVDLKYAERFVIARRNDNEK